MKLTYKEAQALGIDLPHPLKGKRTNNNSPFRQVKNPKAKKPDNNTGHNKIFDKLCLEHGLSLPVCEYLFAEDIGRKWRLDYIWDGWLALEVQGGLFIGGRHARGPSLLKEHEKLNECVMHGISVLFCTPQDVARGAIFPIIKKALKAQEEQA